MELGPVATVLRSTSLDLDSNHQGRGYEFPEILIMEYVQTSP